MAIVVIDPGHGGTTIVGGSSPNNASGPTGLLEKSVTLAVGHRVHSLLMEAGIDARMTRADDINVGLRERAMVAKIIEADVFVSFHFNGYDSETQGTECWLHTNGSASSDALARTVLSGILRATGYRNRGVKREGFAVLSPANHDPETAACLIEISFLDVATDEARLRTEKYLHQLAKSASQAILGFLRDQGRFDDTHALVGFALSESSPPQDGYSVSRT